MTTVYCAEPVLTQKNYTRTKIVDEVERTQSVHTDKYLVAAIPTTNHPFFKDKLFNKNGYYELSMSNFKEMKKIKDISIEYINKDNPESDEQL